MLIRSQNKKVICNFGPGCAIEMLGENDEGKHLIYMSCGQDDYDLGFYSTEDEAMGVAEDIACAATYEYGLYDMPEAAEEPA